MMPSQGKFIVFEGGDGAGKSTQIKLCADFLSTRNTSFVLTREPGGCPLAEDLREIVLRGDNPPIVELMLIMSARAAHIDQVIAPALNAGKWVLCDRFLDSTRAYQGHGLGMDDELILSLHRSVTQGISPDLTILLDISLGESRRRNSTVKDGIEARSEKFQQRVYQGFRDFALASPNDHLLINAEQPLQDIHTIVTEHLDRVLS